MFKNSLHTLLLVILGTQMAAAQQRNSQITIPFKLTSFNNISIKAILNQKDTVDLMFHTAASSLTLTEDATKRIKSINFERTDTVRSWGGDTNSSRYSKNNTLTIGETKWEKIRIWENTSSGPETDGKFGLELFPEQAVEIDFERKMIVIHPQLPKKVKHYQRMELEFRDDMMSANATIKIGDSLILNKYLIHSGYSGTILVDDKFAAEHQLVSKLKLVSERFLKDSFGNKLKTSKAILPLFTIGNSNLTTIPISFFSGAIGRQKMSVVGGDLIKRFNLIISADRRSIFLKANKLTSDPYWEG